MMRYPAMLSLILFVSCPSLAEMTAEQRCEKQGEVAKQAASLRISGTDKDTAMKTLSRMYDRPGSGVTADNVRGMVTVAYMAKMKPEQMEKFAIDQCKKNILKK
jgi:hypothetical protein